MVFQALASTCMVHQQALAAAGSPCVLIRPIQPTSRHEQRRYGKPVLRGHARDGLLTFLAGEPKEEVGEGEEPEFCRFRQFGSRGIQRFFARAAAGSRRVHLGEIKPARTAVFSAYRRLPVT